MKIKKLVEVCRSYIGTKFKHQGRLPFVALDCAGLIICAAKECDFEIKDLVTYSRKPDQEILFKKIEESGLLEVTKNEMKLGDLLMMRYDGNAQHVAIISNENPFYIIHAISDKEVSEHRLDKSLYEKIVKVYRFPNEEQE